MFCSYCLAVLNHFAGTLMNLTIAGELLVDHFGIVLLRFEELVVEVKVVGVV